MKFYEKLYFSKDNPEFVKEHLGSFLLFQIYSPLVIRESYCKWPEFYPFIRENTPVQLVEIIDKSPFISDEKLQKKLNQYQIERAVEVLKAYQNCAVPLTQDPAIKQTRRKLTSTTGDRNLKILEQAQQKALYSNKMADLAIRCSHKFLFDSKNYRSWHITSQMAKDLIQSRRPNEYTFPSIQLTKGCENHCSHCCDRAEPHLSHMPWPVFVNLYREFNKHYRHYPQDRSDHYFSKFFADSDTLSYYDPIMQTDAGDAGLWVREEKGLFLYLTRGVRDDRSRIALNKAICSQQPIAISFVDTSKENMSQNIKQLQDTLDVFDDLPTRKLNPKIFHLHMKSGPSVGDEIFHDFPVEKLGIWAMGRGKAFPPEETEHFPDSEFNTPHVITPNGYVMKSKIKNGENIREKEASLYGVNNYGKPSCCLQNLIKLFKFQR